MIAMLLALQLAANPGTQAPDRWFGEDKFKHLMMTTAVVGFAHAGSRVLTDSNTAVVIGGLAGAVVSVWKELRDERASKRDLVWDALGIALGILTVSRAR